MIQEAIQGHKAARDSVMSANTCVTHPMTSAGSQQLLTLRHGRGKSAGGMREGATSPVLTTSMIEGRVVLLLVCFTIEFDFPETSNSSQQQARELRLSVAARIAQWQREVHEPCAAMALRGYRP